MAPSSTDTLNSLLRRTTLDDHEEVLRAADAVLKSSKDNVDAQHAKIVALLKLDRYTDALAVFESGSDELRQRAVLEQSYALYKVGKWAEAEALAKQDPSTRASEHIKAQAVCISHLLHVLHVSRIS